MAPEGGEIDELLSSRINNGYPRDLLRRFTGSAGGDGTATWAEVGGRDMGEIELGLSLGGCYAAEPKGKGLVRASSMTLSMFPGERIDFPAVATPLTRACSLPTETEEERRKRKEMECLKRMEAKRKRSEKRAAAAANNSNNNRKEENLLDEDLVSMAANGVVVPAEVAKWAAGIGGRVGKRLASQGSIGSQGSSSSGVSDFESRPVQGVDISGVGNCAEGRSPSMIPSEADHTNHRAAAATSKQAVGKPAKLSKEGDEPSRKKSCTSSKLNSVKETERNVLEEMPCVSTTGDGPNGRRIEGFLYKYRKGEEVRIVCVCHGSFLTPAEFVKHAGGGDVAHPLRHIVINPTPSAFL